MTLLPVFRIGWLNAWILTLVILLNPLILVVVDKLVGTGEINKKMGEMPADEQARRKNLIATIILYLLIAYSIFLPLKSGTPWFYIGLATWLIGLVILKLAIVDAAKTPTGQVFTRGMYRISRHPLYLSLSLILLGVSIATASWIFFLMAVIYSSFLNSQARVEEQGCLTTFGEDYAEYLERTPKWIGIPKSR